LKKRTLNEKPQNKCEGERGRANQAKEGITVRNKLKYDLESNLWGGPLEIERGKTQRKKNAGLKKRKKTTLELGNSNATT